MAKGKKKMPIWGKIALGFFGTILSLVLLACIVIWAIWHNEILTYLSMQQVRERNNKHRDGSVYTMHVKGGFYLEDFIKQGGASSDSELIQFVTQKITKGLIPMKLSSPSIGCASFTAVTEDGDALFARNYDFNMTNTCIVFTEANRGRHASISTVDLQFLGIDRNKDVEDPLQQVICLAAPYVPLDGINDAGVSCGIYMSYQGLKVTPTDQQTDKPDLVSTMLIRMILDYADNLEEAIEIARSYDLHDSAGSSFQYMVADSSGRSAILSWINGTSYTDNDGSLRQLVVTYNDDDACIGKEEGEAAYQWVTNFVVRPEYYEGMSTAKKYGFDRYQHLQKALSAVGGVVKDEGAAMDILASIGRRTWKNDDRNGCTVHSAVYNLTDKSVMWVPNENYDDPTAIFTFRLGK